MAPLELLDRPLCDLLLWLILKRLPLHTLRQFICHIRACAWNWEAHHDLSCEVILRELCANFHRELKLISTFLVNEGVQAERGCILPINAIVHDEELAIWRVDCNCFHGFKVACVNTLVEVAVIKSHTSLLTCFGAAHSQVVV